MQGDWGGGTIDKKFFLFLAGLFPQTKRRGGRGDFFFFLHFVPPKKP